MLGNTPLTVSNGNFEKNWALEYGGIGIFNKLVTSTGTPTITISNSDFNDQTAGI